VKDPFDPKKDLLTEKDPGTKTVRLIRCIPCGEVIYDVKPEDSQGILLGKWNAMALHMALMHDSKILPDRVLRIVDPSKEDS